MENSIIIIVLRLDDKKVPKNTDILRNQDFQYTRHRNNCDGISTLFPSHCEIEFDVSIFQHLFYLLLFEIICWHWILILH